jgi:hypothetical protein
MEDVRIFVDIWSILRPFGIFYGQLVYIYGHLVYFMDNWYIFMDIWYILW